MKNQKRNLAEIDYVKSNGAVKLVDLAKKYNVAPGTVRSWKHRYRWNEKLKEGYEVVINRKIINEIEDTDLTEKQRLFCLYYIKTSNATESAIKAGYSKNNPGKIGYQLLENTRIKKEIDKLKELKYQSIMIGEEDIVELKIRIAFADITDFVEFGQKVDNVVNLKNDRLVDGQLIKEIKKGKQGVSIRLEDKMKALEWLANYFDIIPAGKHKKWYDKHQLKLKEKEIKIKEKEIRIKEDF